MQCVLQLQAPPVGPVVRAVRTEWQTVPVAGAAEAAAVVVARPPLP